MFRAEIDSLIRQCRAACDAGLPADQTRDVVLREAIGQALGRLDARAFLDWIKDDREYGSYYYDVQQDGVCAKPREVVALLLESIVMDAMA